MSKLITRLVCGSSFLALAMGANAALAQDAMPVPQDPAQTTVDDIVVTGSRLRRPANESAVPLQVLTTEEIAESGTTDLLEILETLPGVDEGTSPTNSLSAVHASGLSTVNLRRLGSNRTLTLIDGRRAISNSMSSDSVSVDTIPAGFVKRLEVTTGGSSAVYGTDAIAGVVNIIMRDDVEGFLFDSRVSTPFASGGDEFRVEGTWGRRYADDRGYLMIGTSYRDEAGILADASRPESIEPVEFGIPSSDAFARESCGPGALPGQRCLLPDRSGATPGGVFDGDAWFKDGRWYNDKSLRPIDPTTGTYDRGLNEDFNSDYDGWNFRPGNSLAPDRTITTVGLHTTYDFSPRIVGTFTAMYSDVDTHYITAAETIADDETYGYDPTTGLLDTFTIGEIRRTNPLIPAAVEETRSGDLSFDRRMIEVGNNARINNRETTRISADVSGRFSDALEWSVYGTYGHFFQEQWNPNEINFAKTKWALDVVSNGSGGYMCASAVARADGCVPLNIFGEGSITPEAANYIRYNAYGHQSREQVSFGGLVRSDLVDLFGIGIRWAAGLEYREDSQDIQGDPDGDLVGGIDGDPTTNDVLVTSTTVFNSLKASADVTEAFVEVDFELIPDRLNLQFAARGADYSTVGTIFSYNAGVRWNVMEDLGLRMQYSRSQRAPNLTEFYSVERPDYDDLIDPCEGLLPDGTGLSPPRSVGGSSVDLAVVAANCLADPGIQSFFSDPGYVAGTRFDAGSSVYGPNSGNQDLREETADTFTFGFVYQPKWLDRNLSLIVDYYDISISDVISEVSTQNTVDLCYASDDYPANRFCDVITRNPTNGQIVSVVNRVENLNEQVVEGIDASLYWRRIELGTPGSFDLDVRYSHYFRNEESFFDLTGNLLTNDYLPYIGSPENEWRVKVGYRLNDLRVTWTASYEDGGIDDPVNYPTPGGLAYFALDGIWFHRVYASYEFGPRDRYTFYAGINNVMDEIGPIYPTGTLGGSSYNINGPLNDAVGREVYFGLKAEF